MLLRFLFSAIFLISLPAASLAMEQSFSQGGVKAVVKLSPEELRAQENVSLKLSLLKDGAPITDRKVFIEIYEKDSQTPLISREVQTLDDEYLETWKFEKPGDYRVLLKISDPVATERELHYEVNASVGESGGQGHEDHGFFSHHFGGKWGWWGAGLMVLIMVPLMVVGL